MLNDKISGINFVTLPIILKGKYTKKGKQKRLPKIK
jgi:hypothetical protein